MKIDIYHFLWGNVGRIYKIWKFRLFLKLPLLFHLLINGPLYWGISYQLLYYGGQIILGTFYYNCISNCNFDSIAYLLHLHYFSQFSLHLPPYYNSLAVSILGLDQKCDEVVEEEKKGLEIEHNKFVQQERLWGIPAYMKVQDEVRKAVKNAKKNFEKKLGRTTQSPSTATWRKRHCWLLVDFQLF